VAAVDSCHERFEQLKAFQKDHGHCRVSLDKKKKTAQLINWLLCGYQNNWYNINVCEKARKDSSIISEERFQKLYEIGFDW
jgi:hypothetical protein